MKKCLKLFNKKNTSIFALLFINLLFSYKYLNRYTEYAFVLSLVLVLFYSSLLYSLIKVDLSNKKWKIIFYLTLLSFFILGILLFYKVPVTSLNVDRWSVITSFWDQVFQGKYPYYATSNMGNYPGPMPIYFVLNLPFYLVNELGYFSLVGIGIFSHLLLKIKSGWPNKMYILIFVLSSTFLLWELVSRSNIFTNSMIILWLLWSYINSSKKNNLFFFGHAIMCGMLLSTRAVYILPYLIFFIYSLRKKEYTLARFVIFGLVALTAFALTFLPFFLAFPDDFFKMNPFIIQSSFLIPSGYTLIFIFMAIVFSFLTKSKNDLFYFSGLALFLSIFIYIIYNLNKHGLQEFYIGVYADISYFIFCIPFFLFYLLKTNKNPVIS